MKIAAVEALQIFDSRGRPTVEAVVRLTDGSQGHGLVPSGASTGQFEALELRDGDPRRLQGKSVYKAVENIERLIAPRLIGLDAGDQESLDRLLIELDGTPNKSRLGANSLLAVSMAAARAASASQRVPLFRHLGPGTLLPLPEIQIFGGGAHAGGRVDVQDFMVVATGAASYADALEMTANVYHAAGELMRRGGRSAGVADEGGYWPDFRSHDEALSMLVSSIEAAGYQPGRDVAISLDVAASELYDGSEYRFRLEDRVYSSAALVELMREWCERFPIVSIEDPLADTDWAGWQLATRTLGSRVQLVGDDLFTTNLARIEEGIAREAANAVLIKLNQIGTVSETLAAIRRTQAAGWSPIVSARSGETEDAFIAHLAVASDAGQLKVGSFSRGERMAKWNEVLRIGRALGDEARYLGAKMLAGTSGYSLGNG